VILAVCLNPALDITYRTTEVRSGGSHQVEIVRERAGGKGINVARVLHQLGEPVTITGLLGGHRGQVISKELAGEGIVAALSEIAGSSRRSFAVVDYSDATVFNEVGPQVSEAEWAAFCGRFRELACSAQVVTLSGSAPNGVPDNAYAELVALAGDVPVVLDASGPQLIQALAERPAVVAPNRAEVAEALDRSIDGLDQLVAAASELRGLGATSVVVSSGTDGLLAVSGQGAWLARPPRLINGTPTGAGDALTAAIAAGLSREQTWPELLAAGVSWSAGAVAMLWAGQVDESVMADVRSQVIVEAL
jgi:tagatose 6-phosphate kinase